MVLRPSMLEGGEQQSSKASCQYSDWHCTSHLAILHIEVCEACLSTADLPKPIWPIGRQSFLLCHPMRSLPFM